MVHLSPKTKLFLILNACIGIGCIVAIYLGRDVSLPGVISRDHTSKFTYTSPILDYESLSQNDSTVISYKIMHKTVQESAAAHSLSSYAVYYRNLNDGQWIGINEKDTFAPASLMKTPLLIAFLKGVEKKPALLGTAVVATGEDFEYALAQNFEVQTRIKKGETYTLRQVAEHMIQDSDNVAAIMLSKYIKESDFKALFESVGVSQEENGSDIDVRVKDFAAFFRVLYNASYLNRDMSELALSMLAGSTFRSGIVAGVPPTVSVAHKYGERSIEQKINGGTIVKEKQLHDCGIVYTSPNPYILCIMTKGADFEAQQKFIAEISRYVYKEVGGK